METVHLVENTLAGFWRRILAFLLDALALGLVGFLSGLVLAEVYAAMGGWGRLLGFFIAMAYFGILNSQVAGGQTLGKRCFCIRVVGKDGEPVTPGRSLLRYLGLGIPFFLNNTQLPNSITESLLACLLALVVIGGLSSTIYLLLFNRRTHQSLHDLLAGTYVVRAGPAVLPSDRPAAIHGVVVLVLALLSSLAPVLAKHLVPQAPFEALTKASSALMQQADVRFVAMADGGSVLDATGSGKPMETYVSANVYLKQSRVDDGQLARQLAQIILDTYPPAVRRGQISITLSYGYDIGIASQWRSHSFAFDPVALLHGQ